MVTSARFALYELATACGYTCADCARAIHPRELEVDCALGGQLRCPSCAGPSPTGDASMPGDGTPDGTSDGTSDDSDASEDDGGGG